MHPGIPPIGTPTTGAFMSNDTKPDDDLGFDPDSPDLADPQIDPPKPAKKPESEQSDETGDTDAYPPYGTKD
nr:DUF6021 family protein [Pseudomonas coleopterorum]